MLFLQVLGCLLLIFGTMVCSMIATIVLAVSEGDKFEILTGVVLIIVPWAITITVASKVLVS